MSALTVLIGAGASYDCVDDTAGVVPEWRPPLAFQLFERRSTFSPVLAKYPMAVSVAEQVRVALRGAGENPSFSIETLLRSIADEADAIVRSRFRQVPLYIQELIGEVGRHYLADGTTKFTTLVEEIQRRIGGKFNKVVYLSLNYDLFLDRELERLYNFRFERMTDYYARHNWSLIKLHGSVNWGFPLFETREHELAPCLAHLPEVSDDRIARMSDTTLLAHHQDRFQKGRFMYPALALPLETKSGFACPREHIENAHARVSESDSFLVIGCRIADNDVLALLGNAKSVRNVRIIGKDAEDAEQVGRRLARANKVFADFLGDSRRERSNIYKGGFCSFVASGQLREFLGQ